MRFSHSSIRSVGALHVLKEFITSVLKWFLVLNLGIGWTLFWGNVARIHVSMGDFRSAFITVALFIGPILLAVTWFVAKYATVLPTEFDTGLTDATN